MAAPPIYKEMTARRLFGDEYYPSSLSSGSSGSGPHGLKFHKGLSRQGLRIGHDGFVDWKYNAPQLPYNWSLSKKTYNNIIICFLEFWMMTVGSAGTSASMHARMEFGLSQISGYFVFMSIYLFGQAIGSVVFSPISETFGRRKLYIASISTYCIFSALVSAIPSAFAVALGRFVTGAASAVPATVAFGSFEDMHSTETRIWIVYIYTLAGNCGLVLGPIYSAYVGAYIGWRWVFYISAILSGLATVAAIFMQESHIEYLLELKYKEVVKIMDDDDLRIPEKKKLTIQAFATNSLFRPLQILFTEPIVICCAVLVIISFSLIYGLTEGLTVVYTEFGFTETTTSSLAFIPLLIGLIINVLPRIYDQHVFERHRDQNVLIQSETKIRSLVTSCPALAIGMWLFAWTIPPKVLVVPWEFSMIGLFFIGYAINDFAYIFFGYLTDTYGRYAASACAALNLSRTVMAALFPLFTWNMYLNLGCNIATTIFATIATIFCITPIVFIKFGQRLRQMSRFAHSDKDDYKWRPDEEKDTRNQSPNVQT